MLLSQYPLKVKENAIDHDTTNQKENEKDNKASKSDLRICQLPIYQHTY